MSTQNIALRQDILATLVFYDQFSYPLTAWEIWRGLYQYPESMNQESRIQEEIRFSQLVEILKSDECIEKHVVFHEGYFFLKGREEIVKIRHERLLSSLKKYKKVTWFLKFMALLPFIRFIGICNSLAYKNARDESDVDLFVVAKSNRAHEARMLAGFFAALFRMRPTKHSSKNKICLSFFVDEDNLNLSSLRLGNNDIYFHYWVFHIQPIFEEENFWKNFCAENEWLSSFLQENMFSKEFFPLWRPWKFFLFFKHRLESLLQFFIQGKIRVWLLKFEEKKLSPKIKKIKNKNNDTRVVITPGILKFHPDDRREEYREFFQKKLQEILISNESQES